MSTSPVLELPDVPDEIIKEILLRLPVKSLLRFRCVSKSWHSLISSPHFIKAHFHYFSTAIRLLSPLIQTDDDGETLLEAFSTFSVPINVGDTVSRGSVPFSMADGGGGPRMIASCNGLVCLVFRNTINIWNPTTRENLTLPFSFSLTDLAFGYDEVNDDYKVVKLQSWDPFVERCVPDVEVYSLRVGSWKDVEWGFEKSKFFKGLYANGAVYWPDCYDLEGNPVVVALDMATETCSVLSLPSFQNIDGTAKKSLVVSDGHVWLCYLCGEKMDVWRLEGDGLGESWTKFVSIRNVPNPRYQHRSPLFVSENGAVLLKYSMRVMFYKDLHFHEVLKLPDGLGSSVIAYRESLFSPFLNGVAN